MTRRTDTGLELDWQATNPGDYASSVHIGLPPVVGSDGIVYGFWESPDLASVPVTPPGGTADWSTELVVPEDRKRAVASIERVRAGEDVVFEYRIRRPSDGQIRWLRNTDFPITDEDR